MLRINIDSIMNMEFTPLEKLKVTKPVNRLKYIQNLCINKKVLDIGCYDETAVMLKKGTDYWLHGLISNVAKSVIGIDFSDLIKKEIKTGEYSSIIKYNVFDIDEKFKKEYPVDVIVAGEFIEHIEDVQLFFKNMKMLYPHSKLIISTPNATSLTNVLLAMIKMESSHKDHVHVFSFKTLSSVCIKSGIKSFTIRPYYVCYSEMYLRNRGLKRILVKIFEKVVNFTEYCFPMLSEGYIVEMEL